MASPLARVRGAKIKLFVQLEREKPMKMSTKGRYAVMAMIDIGQHSAGEPVSLAEIAERQDISQEYLEQLFGKLRRDKLVESARGPGRRLSAGAPR